MIHVYTGNGKGKTTCALGLIVRALGRGKKIALVQFMKKWEYGEIIFLEKQDNIEIFQYGTRDFVDPEKPAEVDYQEAQKAFQKAIECLDSSKYDLLVLDEINVAVAWKVLPLSCQLEIFNHSSSTEIIMTGRNANKEVIEKADLVTEMKEIKHYYNKNIVAREGIEY